MKELSQAIIRDLILYREKQKNVLSSKGIADLCNRHPSQIRQRAANGERIYRRFLINEPGLTIDDLLHRNGIDPYVAFDNLAKEFKESKVIVSSRTNEDYAVPENIQSEDCLADYFPRGLALSMVAIGLLKSDMMVKEFGEFLTGNFESQQFADELNAAANIGRKRLAYLVEFIETHREVLSVPDEFLTALEECMGSPRAKP